MSEQEHRRVPGGSAKSVARRKRLIAAFVELLAEGVPYTQLSPEMITERAGVTRPAFYFYFKGKSDVLIDVIGDVRIRLFEAATPFLQCKHSNLRASLAESLWASSSVRMQQRHLLRAALEAFVTSPAFRDYYLLSIAEAVDALGESIYKIRKQACHPVSKRLSRDIARTLVGSHDFSLSIFEPSGEDWKPLVEATIVVWTAAIFGPP